MMHPSKGTAIVMDLGLPQGKLDYIFRRRFMKRIIPLFALLFVFALGCVMAEEGHPVEPSGAGTETVLSQQDLGQGFYIDARGVEAEIIMVANSVEAVRKGDPPLAHRYTAGQYLIRPHAVRLRLTQLYKPII
jgi:hypothetical protein